MHGTHITECMKIAHASVCQTHTVEMQAVARGFVASLKSSHPPHRLDCAPFAYTLLVVAKSTIVRTELTKFHVLCMYYYERKP